jgi:hypothetical protein
MTLPNIIDALNRNVSGGSTNQLVQLDPKYIKAMVHSFRALQAEKDYKKNNLNINDAYYQRFYLKYDPNLQSSAPVGSVIFSFLPTFSFLGEDGIRFGGSLGGTNTQPVNARPCIKQWTRIMGRAKFATIQSHPYTRIENNPKKVYFLPNNFEGTLEVYNDTLITEGVIEGVFPDPTQVPGFNEEVDNYPMPEDSLPELKSLIYEDRLAIVKTTKPNDESDPQHTTERPLKPQVIPPQ